MCIVPGSTDGLVVRVGKDGDASRALKKLTKKLEIDGVFRFLRRREKAAGPEARDRLKRRDSLRRTLKMKLRAEREVERDKRAKTLAARRRARGAGRQGGS